MTSHGELVGSTNVGSIRSGHYMVSQLDDDSEEEEPDLPQTIVDHQHKSVSDMDAVWQPARAKNGDKEQRPFLFTAAKRKNSVMDINQLARLFDYLSVYSEQLTTPRWNHFRGLRLSRTDRIRLNNLIWREFYTQIVRQKKPIFVKFEAPTLENHLRPKSVVLEGKYWKRRFDSVCLEYLRWRCFYKLRLSGSGYPLSMTDADLLEHVASTHQGYLSSDGFPCNPMEATDDLLSDLVNNLDWLLDASATTAGGLPTVSTTHTDQSINFPELSRDFGQVNSNADIMQPLLLQMASNVDDTAVDFLANLISTSAPSPLPSPLPHHWGASGGDLPTSSLPPPPSPSSLAPVAMAPSGQEQMLLPTSCPVITMHQPMAPFAQASPVPGQTPLQMPVMKAPEAAITVTSAASLPRQLSTKVQPLASPFLEQQQQQQHKKHVLEMVETGAPEALRAQQQQQQLQQQFQQQLQQQQQQKQLELQRQQQQLQQQQEQEHQRSFGPSKPGLVQPQAASLGSATLLVTFGSRASPSPGEPAPSRAPQRGATGIATRKEPYTKRRKRSSGPIRHARPTPIAPKPHSDGLPRRTSALAGLLVPAATPGPEEKAGEPEQEAPAAVDCHLLLDNVNKRLNLQRYERRWPSCSELLGQEASSTPVSCCQPASEGHMCSVGSFPDVSDTFNFSGLAPPPQLPPPPPPLLKGAEVKEEERTPSEVRRRSNINMGLEMLHSLLPENVCGSPGAKLLPMPKAMVLLRSSAYIRKLRRERSMVEAECRALKQEAEALQNEINACCAKLPETGLPTPPIGSDKGQRWFRAYIQASTLRNWKFYIFSLIAEKLFSAYTSLVSMNNVQDFTVSAMTWLEQYCSMTSMRNFVMVALRKLSTKTSVLTDASRLPQEAVKAVSEAEQKDPIGMVS